MGHGATNPSKTQFYAGILHSIFQGLPQLQSINSSLLEELVISLKKGRAVQDRPSRKTSSEVDQNLDMSSVPALAASMWGACLAGALRVHAQAQAGLGAIGGEWQDFAGRQFKENFAFMQRLGHHRSPDEILALYTEFWRRAADDYGKDITTLTKLAADATTEMVKASQSAADEATNCLTGQTQARPRRST